MVSLISQERVNFLSSNQKAELSKHFNESGATAMPHQLAVLLGIDYSDALAILAILEADGLCNNKLLIYHRCEPDVPAGAIPYGQGFPNLPWACPLCQEEVEDYDELSFDIMAIASKVIKFA